MPSILEYPFQISLSYGLIPVCTHLYNRIFSVVNAISGKVIQSICFFLKVCVVRSIYTLQNWVYTKKHSPYTCEVLKSNQHILKSPKKQKKALSKYSASLLLAMYLGLFQAVSQLILMP